MSGYEKRVTPISESEREAMRSELSIDWQAHALALQAEVEELRRRKRAAEFWERLVRMVVARSEWRAFYEADERGACDEVMIDYLAALQTRVDAVTAVRDNWDKQVADRIDGVPATLAWALADVNIALGVDPSGAALGVDPQKEDGTK